MDPTNFIANLVNASRTRSPVVVEDVNVNMDLANFMEDLIDACTRAQRTVIFEDVNRATNTIGRIIVRFECNNCRQANVRCAMGRLYCVQCCGHPECN